MDDTDESPENVAILVAERSDQCAQPLDDPNLFENLITDRLSAPVPRNKKGPHK